MSLLVMVQGQGHGVQGCLFQLHTADVMSTDQWNDSSQLTISMYDPAQAIARYSPSYEKLSAFIALLWGGISIDPYMTMLCTHSHEVIVRVHIQSERSNILTIES